MSALARSLCLRWPVGNRPFAEQIQLEATDRFGRHDLSIRPLEEERIVGTLHDARAALNAIVWRTQNREAPSRVHLEDTGRAHVLARTHSAALPLFQDDSKQPIRVKSALVGGRASHEVDVEDDQDGQCHQTPAQHEFPFQSARASHRWRAATKTSMRCLPPSKRSPSSAQQVAAVLDLDPLGEHEVRPPRLPIGSSRPTRPTASSHRWPRARDPRRTA